MAARTLLQQAVPGTFGCKAAGWLVAVLEARRRLGHVRSRAAGGAARRCGRDARGSRGAGSGGATSPGGGARAGGARAAMAHEPDTNRRAGRSARHVCVRAREDRSRSRAARTDGGGGGAGADGRRIVHDAPEAQPRPVRGRAGLRRAGERLRVGARPLGRPGARARGGRVARGVGGALRSARVHGRCGVEHRRGAGESRRGHRRACERTSS